LGHCDAVAIFLHKISFNGSTIEVSREYATVTIPNECLVQIKKRNGNKHGKRTFSLALSWLLGVGTNDKLALCFWISKEGAEGW
jgi:hypothetical protein